MSTIPQGIPSELEETITAVRIVAGQLYGYDGSGPIKDWFNKLTDEQKFRAFNLQHEASKDRFDASMLPEDGRVDEIFRRFNKRLEALVRSSIKQGSTPEEQAALKSRITIHLQDS